MRGVRGRGCRDMWWKVAASNVMLGDDSDAPVCPPHTCFPQHDKGCCPYHPSPDDRESKTRGYSPTLGG